jgi:hypothetical protein
MPGPGRPFQLGNTFGKGRPLGSKNLKTLQPKAEKVLETALDTGDTRVAMYVNDKNNDDREPDGLTAAQLMDGIIAILRLKMPAAVDVLDAEFSEVPRALPDPDPAA